MNVYEKRGIPTIINAAGTLTRLSGGVLRPEAIDAMADAATRAVDMEVLQAHASMVISEITGAEAGYVASGAAACLLLGTAACITGLDSGKMARLPDTTGLPNQVVVARNHRNSYDHAVRTAGATLVEVGLPYRTPGDGVRETEPFEYAAAIGEQTAAVFWVADRCATPPLREVVAVAHAAGVPVIVDAAAQLPPQRNLRRFIDDGADLVAFSGGKAIGGPQASGLLCGRTDLIMAAALQNLDMDVLPELWEPPPSLIERQRVLGLPRQGIGRTCKAGKEEIIGLLTALELFVEEGDRRRHETWLADIEQIAGYCIGRGDAECHIRNASASDDVPLLEIALPNGDGKAALNVVKALRDGSPSIHVDPALSARGILNVNPLALREGDAETVGQRLAVALDSVASMGRGHP